MISHGSSNYKDEGIFGFETNDAVQSLLCLHNRERTPSVIKTELSLYAIRYGPYLNTINSQMFQHDYVYLKRYTVKIPLTLFSQRIINY